MNKKYLVIYNEIAKQIDEKLWEPDQLLPSEHELKEQYNTSRETIRKALNLLSQNGYIQKVRGKGSVVIPRNKYDFPVSGLVSFKELAEKMNNQTKTIVHDVSLIKPNSYLKQQLQLNSKDQVWQVIRVRDLDGGKVILDKDFFNERYVPFLSKEICQDSIYAYLEGEMNLSISFAKKEITVDEPTEEDQQLLDLDGFHNVVVIKNYVYLDDASLFQYTESRHRPDRFRFVDFARRQQ
ncbi:trehalose operon repressor [Paraliobacillus quinghaiensis]|uniref:trehalose operon repressor n=1 Tax=Paraliobacillus quinghaiensis TaxID=470815 RepID=UPI00166A6299|nr:trehalose operon repressor [Paraliobacillus quinghaiensis]